MITIYQDLCREIEGLQERISNYKIDIKYYRKLIHKNAPQEPTGMSNDGMPKGNANYMSLDRIYDTIWKLESHKLLHEEMLKSKMESRKRIEYLLSQMDGIEYKVFYLHVVKGMTLLEVSEKLGYSHDHVRRVSSKIQIKA